jgi:integrase
VSSCASGTARQRKASATVRIRNELHLLTSIVAWGQTHRVGGKRLITVDPLHGVVLPREKNAKRPIATEERYGKLFGKGGPGRVHGPVPFGAHALARETGRRINSICKLSVRDILLSRDQLLTALGSAGLPLAWADQWPHGAILWRAANDKKGCESIAPLAERARSALDAYLTRYPMAGDVPLFPGRGKPDQSINKEIAGYWLSKAETLAKLPKLARGGFHPFRRLWASERRHLPAQDVAAAGGWRSLEVMRNAYQHADASGMMAAVDSLQPSDLHVSMRQFVREREHNRRRGGKMRVPVEIGRHRFQHESSAHGCHRSDDQECRDHNSQDHHCAPIRRLAPDRAGNSQCLTRAPTHRTS